jgi:hypothetical protein
MTHREARRLIIRDRVRPQRDYIFDLQKSEETVVSIPAARLCKQPEEQKDVANADGVVREMGLSGSGLPEGTSALFEHWIVMAMAGACDPPSRRGFDNLRKPEICVRGLGAMLGRDGQTDRPAVDNRRRDAARAAIETLPAENDLHANWPPSKCYRM